MSVLRPGARRASFITCLLAAAILAAGVPATAIPEATSEQRDPSGTPYVTLEKAAFSTPVDGAFSLTSSIVVDRPTTYLESRVQIHNPGGRLLYQKTEIRHDITTGTVTIGYQRELDDLDLSPGVYPIELRVRSDSADEVREWVVEDQLLLYDPASDPVPLALVARISSAPSYDSEGRFVIDPADSDSARRHVDELASFILEEPAVRLTLALPPMLAEEWSRIAAGYETSGPEGVRAVGADEPVPRLHAETLTRLDAAIATGRLELLTVPYSDPDLTGMQASGRMGDLEDQYARGLSATLASLESSASSGTAFATDVVPAATIDQLVPRGIAYLLVGPASLATTETTPSSGPYRVGGGEFPIALLTDPGTDEALRSSSASSVAIPAFERAISDAPHVPMIAVLEFGPGHDMAVDDLRECVTELVAAPWLDLVTAGTAADTPPVGEIALDPAPLATSPAPSGYWTEVAESRALAGAFLDSVGVNDPDAQAANDASLIAQSQTWAGPDGAWSSAERGLGFAAAGTRAASTVLDAVTVSAQDITLSSARGEVPITIDNASDKSLLLEIVTKATGMALPPRQVPAVTVRPQENFVTVPVDLQSSLSGQLTVEIYAGEILVDEAVVTVRASFLDRLAIVGTIAVVLVGLLLFIRRRARRADTAGNMGESARSAADEGPAT